MRWMLGIAARAFVHATIDMALIVLSLIAFCAIAKRMS